jgi:hypothetical protein
MTIICFLSGLCPRAKIFKFKKENLAHLLLHDTKSSQLEKAKEPNFGKYFLKIKTKLAGYSIIID